MIANVTGLIVVAPFLAVLARDMRRARRVIAEPPAPERTRASGSQSPAPGHTHHPATRLLTARFYTDGCVLVWDATGLLIHAFGAGDGDRDWDRWLQEMTDDQH